MPDAASVSPGRLARGRRTPTEYDAPVGGCRRTLPAGGAVAPAALQQLPGAVLERRPQGARPAGPLLPPDYVAVDDLLVVDGVPLPGEDPRAREPPSRPGGVAPGGSGRPAARRGHPARRRRSSCRRARRPAVAGDALRTARRTQRVRSSGEASGSGSRRPRGWWRWSLAWAASSSLLVASAGVVGRCAVARDRCGELPTDWLTVTVPASLGRVTDVGTSLLITLAACWPAAWCAAVIVVGLVTAQTSLRAAPADQREQPVTIDYGTSN